MPQTIQGGTNVGTSGNDNLRTLYYDSATETTTIYSALSGLGGNDNLDNNGGFSSVTMDGGLGNDRISNTVNGGDNSKLIGGSGNDNIQNGSSTVQLNNATIDGGADSDTIQNYGDNASISAADGDDSIYGVGDKATITGGNDNDSISNYGDDSSIDGGNGNDWLEDWGSNVTVSGGTGNDTLRGGGGNEQSRVSNVFFEDTIGNNRFSLFYTTNGTINAGTGDNSVYAWYDSDVTIQAQNGNDSLYLQDSSNMSIDAGDGANYIDIDNLNDSTAAGYTINAGTGNDTVHVYRGHRALISTGGGDDSINNVGHNSTINGGDGDDWINNHGGGRDYDVNSTMSSNNLIDGGKGNDSITNGCDNVTINGGDNDDYISSAGVDKVLINGGDGNDTIENIGNINREVSTNSTLNGGAGDDYIYNLGNKVTITAGTGNDTVLLATGRDVAKQDTGSENVLINYSSGDGNDLIKFFNATSTLSIGGGNYSSAVSGNDVVLTVGNNKVTLSEAATLDNLNIVGNSDTTSADTTSGDTTSSDTNSSSLGDTIKAAVVADMILHRTEAGYPVIAGLAFHPEEYHGDEPTNYAAKENWSITSKDGLELNGIHYTPENSNDKWVIIIHGYGHNHKHMYPFAGFYLANGYNVLMVDQRAAGDSEGEWLTMGAAESQDIALWTQEIARRNSDAKITLFGVSMGSATAMLAAARSDITNVTSLVEDCGYTNMMDVVSLLHSNIPAMQSLLSAQDLPVLDTVASVFTGYNLSDAAPLDSISNAKMPSLFITGSEDAVVPVSALTALYDASGADVKEQFIVQGATHGVAGLYDPVGYSNTTFRFLAEANGEGWVTENITDDILLRGTKYGDSIGNSGDNVTIDTYAGNDSITSSGAKASIDAGDGNDSVYASGTNSTIDGGDGSNFVDLTDSKGLYVVFNGQTTVDGFNLGFGSGSDTLYIPGAPAGVDFRSGILTFYDDSNAVVLSDVTTTAKVNLYHESRQMLNKGVFIADNDWYSVERGDLSVKSGEEVYFVGSSASPNHGVDFSGISSSLNLTLDTAYIDSEDYVPGTKTWINGVYSIRGGAGLTTITGSDKSDTIFAGTGRTTINARGGNDYISLASAKALVEYSSGDGNDVIAGFNKNSTLNISGTSYSSSTSGDNVVLNVGSGKITLEGAADLDNLNITSSDAPSGTGVTVDNSANNTLITGTAYDDSIYNSGRRVTINGLAGDDFIANDIDSSVTVASQVANLIDAGAGNDTIYNHHSYHPTLLGGDGNDSIVVNKGHRIFADGGAGNDSIIGQTTDNGDSSDWAMGGYATILGGDGNDYISPFYSNNATILGGSGNDTIIMMGADSTINGASGDDRISLGTADSVNVLINYTSGDGNDLINGFTENDTLNLTGAKYHSVASGNDLILTVGNGRVSLKGAGTLDDINIIGSYDEAADEIISNTRNAASVIGTSGNDTITNTGSRSTIDALAGDDSITSNASNVLLYAGDGSDSIFASGRLSTIDGGAGSNLVSVTGSQGLYVVMDGNTTVDGFNAGFGSGADTILINGDAPSVDFRTDGLTLYNGSQSILLDGVTSTAKINLYYADAAVHGVNEVFIADDDSYKVTDSDLRQSNLYFVGATASPNHGIDFSDITRAVNVTLDTDYEATPSFWVNNIYSIVGGAGSTTITGSDKSDTIQAGTGNTTINAAGGNDRISLTSARAIVNYSSGDGNDFIAGFNENSTLRIFDADFSSVESGSDVVLTVGSGKLTLEGAADLEDLNIVGTSNDTILPDNTDIYTGGDETISSYAGQPVVVGAEYQSSSFDGLGNFVVYSSDGKLTIENVVDKVVDLRDTDGNEMLKAYQASTGGVIDGRGLNGYQVISGANNSSDIIYTADNGSVLWGGSGNVADALLGGDGVDVFVAGQYQGADNIFNAGTDDIVNLNDAALSDIVAAADVGDNKIVVNFRSGNAIAVNSDDSLSAAFVLSDGTAYRYDHTNKTWQSA